MEMKLTQRFQLQRPETDFEISPTMPPEEMARRVRLAFKQMPEESALIVFAKVMTSDVPHEMKVAVWDAVRYSHIWWHVDEVLKGDVMENPIVQCAFADAVAMRYWRVENKKPDWMWTQCATREAWRIDLDPRRDGTSWAREEFSDLIMKMVRKPDRYVTELVLALWDQGKQYGIREKMLQFNDFNGNNLLWYLTYRDDQQAQEGFACPETAKILIDLGIDPNHRNKLGLSWNDVARHVNRPEADK